MNKLLSLLTSEQLKRVRISTFDKDEVIFHEEDTCQEISIILEGVIEISSITKNGKKIIYNTVLTNQVFGNNLIFSSENLYRGDVICKTKCKIAFIDYKTLVDIISSNQNFMIEYLKIQSDFGKVLNSKIKILSFNNGEDRLLYYLEIHNNQIKVVSIANLAKELNLTREATSRLISKLIKENILIREDVNNYIIIRLADNKWGKTNR